MPYVFEPAFTNSDEFFYWLNDFANDWRYMYETPIVNLAKDSELTLASFVSGCDTMIDAAKDFGYVELVDTLQSCKQSGRSLLSVTTQEKESSQRELSNLFAQLKENIAISQAKPSIVLATCPATPQSDVQANGPAAPLPDALGSESKVIRKKQSHNQDDAKDKLIAALTKHHKYADGSCLNTEPIGNNELARLAEVSNGTVSKFFKDKFEGYTNYKQYCRNTSTLIASLKLLNDEYSPYLFLGKGAARIPAPTEGDD